MTIREWFREWSGLAQDARSGTMREKFIIDALGRLSGQIERMEQKPTPSLRPPAPPADWEQSQLKALYELQSEKGN